MRTGRPIRCPYSSSELSPWISAIARKGGYPRFSPAARLEARWSLVVRNARAFSPGVAKPESVDPSLCVVAL